MSFYLLKPCRGKAAFEAVPKEKVQLDMERGKAALESQGYDVTDAHVMLVCTTENLQVSIYPSGKLLIQTESREDAMNHANGIYEILGIGKEI